MVGGALTHRGFAAVGAYPQALHSAVDIAAAIAGLLVLGGLWTPAAGVAVGVLEVWVAITEPASLPSAIALAAQGFSLSMIGPGAWSIDARLYGRKQIVTPEP